jgi:hypothetical protein
MHMQTTGNVLVTINAKSKEEALEIARKLKNFKLDEKYGPIDLGGGKYVVRGVSTGPVK